MLLVDDDPNFLALATGISEGAGLEVVATARDAASALIAANDTQPDAMLVDVGLPGRRDGIHLGTELAALPWRPQVVLTSTDGEAVRALDSRAVTLPFIPKKELSPDRLRSVFGIE
jgi:DNA-binding response OmpR family regulator